MLFIGDKRYRQQRGSVRRIRPDLQRVPSTTVAIHVPFIVAGPGVRAAPRRMRLSTSADLFATILELAGIDIAEAVRQKSHWTR